MSDHTEVPWNVLMQQIVAETCKEAVEEVDNVRSVEPIVHPSDMQDGQSDLRVICNDGLEFEVLIRPILREHASYVSERDRSLNPVTFRSSMPSAPQLTASRMHIGVGGAGSTQVSKMVTMVMHVDDGEQILGHTNLDEDLVVRGLRLLFPHGELSGGAELVCQELVNWWSGFDSGDMEGYGLVQELEPIIASAQRVLAAT